MNNPPPSSLARRELARLIDHTLRRSETTAREIDALCAEARQHGFGSVCVCGSRVAQAAALLEASDVKVTCAVGFPLGAADADVKRYETEVAIDHGAHEIEVVLNSGLLKDGENEAVLRELRDVVEAADEHPVKVLIETSLLTREQVILAAQLAVDSEAKFITLSAVFGTRELSPDLLTATREAVGPKFGIKVFAHTTMLADAARLLDSGATRIGITLVPKP